MVAITVILAAVIGSFVLGMAGNQSVAPQVSWSGSEATDTVTFTHQGGSSVEETELAVAVNGTTVDENDGGWTGTAGTITAGDEISVETGDSLTTSDFQNGNTARLIWEDPDSDNTQILSTYTLNSQS